MSQDFPKDLTKGQVIINFLKLLKFDIYLFLQCIAIVMQGVTITQLAEDKMCINQLHFPKEYCLTLTTNHSHESTTQSILVHANTLKNWQTVIETVPSTIIALFLSYWLQNYPHYLKTLIMVPCFGYIIQIFIFLTNAFFFKVPSWAILLAYVPSGLLGGITLLISSYSTYVSWSTPTRFLIIRFAIFELVTKIGVLTGTYAGGNILAMKPWFHDQPENYLGVLIVSLGLLVLSLILGFFIHLEGVPETAAHLASRGHKEIAKDVFQFSRFKELAQPLVVKRTGKNRLKLIFLVISGVIVWITISGDDAIAFQFTQQVYGWSASKYTKLSTFLNAMPAVLTVIAPQIFKMFNLHDATIGLIGILSLLSANAIKGVITNEIGYVMCVLSAGLSSLASIANRALISQIIDPEETAKVFAILGSLNSYMSIAAAYAYTSIFSATINTRPGLIYNLATFLLIFPMGNFLVNNITMNRSKSKSTPSPPNLPTISPSLDISGNPIELDSKPNHSGETQVEIVSPSV